MHRFESAKSLIINNQTINAKYIQILLSINYSNFEENFINDFININKSIPIIYINNDNKIKKHICQNLAELFCKKYPKFQSTTRKPHKCNFNRDMLIDYCSTFEIDFKKENIDIIIFDILINTLNNEAKNLAIEQNDYPKKCDKYNLFLFYLSKDYIKTEIERIINS